MTKSEEAFFDKVKKDKLSSAASVRSSQRDSVWGTPAPSSFDHSRPSCEYNYWSSFSATHDLPSLLAPSQSGFTSADGYTGPPNDQGDVVIMTGLQIAMAREIGGWPLYTIVIAAGQVCSNVCMQRHILTSFVDVECNEFPNHTIVGPELANGLAALRPWWCLPCLVCCLVHLLPLQALGLRARRSMVVLLYRILPHRIAVRRYGSPSCSRYLDECCNLGVCRGFLRCVRVLRSQLRRGSCTCLQTSFV